MDSFDSQANCVWIVVVAVVLNVDRMFAVASCCCSIVVVVVFDVDVADV